MPKRAAEEGGEGDASKKAKVNDGPASSELQKDEEGNYYLDLGNKKRASVSVFKGKPLVNIREFYSDKSGELKPGKKGITLSSEQWSSLVSGAAGLSDQLKAVEDQNTEEKGTEKEKEKEKRKKKEKPKEKEKAKAKDDKVTKSKRAEKKPTKKKEPESESEPESDEEA